MKTKLLFAALFAALFAFLFAPVADAQVIFDAFTDSTSFAENVASGGARVDGPGTITVTQNSTLTNNIFLSLTSTDDIGTLLSSAGLPALTLNDTIRLTWTVSSASELVGNGVEFGTTNGPADNFRGDGIDANTLLRLRVNNSAAFPNEPGLAPDNIFVAGNDSDGHYAEDLGYEINIRKESLEDGFTLIQEISTAGIVNVVTDVAFGDSNLDYNPANPNNPGANNPVAGDVAVFPLLPFNNMNPATGDFDAGPNNPGTNPNQNVPLNFLTYFNGSRFYGGTHSPSAQGAGPINQYVTTAAFMEINPTTPLPMQVPEPTTAVIATLALGMCCLSRRRD